MSRDVAGKLIRGHSKIEDLMVSSHKVAASTAQLLAASKVPQTLGTDSPVDIGHLPGEGASCALS